MYIAIYCSVIVVFCALVVTLFVVKDKKDKKRYKKLNQPDEKDEKSKGVILSETAEAQSNQDIKLEKETISPNFETFSLEEPKTEKKEGRNRHIRMNPFAADEDEKEDNDKNVDDKFAEYERFLRENLDIDDEDEKEENADDDETEDNFSEYEDFLRKNVNMHEGGDDDLQALRNFDYNSIKGKSESEIKEIIKTLPSKAQEILMTDILARKNWEDEN